MNFGNRTWAEVDLDCIAFNVKQIRSLVGKRKEIMGVVKADAYGHGVYHVAKELLDNGVDRLAVSMLDEAIQLRQQGFEVPILVLSYTDPSRANEIIEFGITQTVYSHDLAEALSSVAASKGQNVRIHIKIDTGMSRVGFPPGFAAIQNVTRISKLPGIIVEGIFTHFASADEEESVYTEMQFERFMSICNELQRVGVYIPIKHVANSAAILKYPHMHLDMVRPGLILYGLYPFESEVEFKPAMQLKSQVILIKDVEPDIDVSYGRTFRTKKQSKIATIPIGYADGYIRAFSNQAQMLVKGKRANVIGRVCMDQCMIDVTNMDVSLGDEVVIIGNQANETVLASELADIAGTINYEIICLVGKRVPRMYIRNGKSIDVLNYLI